MSTLIDLYELSPMQQGMLFHTLYESVPQSESITLAKSYIEQRACQLHGQLNSVAFQQAWQLVVDRHPILRSGFYWQEVEKPLQAVFDYAELPWVEQDWQHLTSSEQAVQLTTFLQQDRAQAFALNQPPLMRCALFQLDRDTYQFVWTHHHLLMDGWCNAILLKEVIQFYEAICQNRSLSLAPPPDYREYISWLQKQDQTQAEQFWRCTLQGLTTPTSLLASLAIGQPQIHGLSSEQQAVREQQRYLSATVTEQLQSFCQQYCLTLSTLIQAAWSLVLSHYSQESDSQESDSQESDVLFGITVSGRPSDLPGIESTIGLFINTLPVRVQLPDEEMSDEETILEWLQQIQARQVEREQYAYSSLVDIHAWSQVPRDVPLFESLVVIENYPVSIDTALQHQSLLRISHSTGFAQTNYPLTLSVLPGEKLGLQIHYTQQFTLDLVDRFLEYLQNILQTIIRHPNQRLAQVSFITPFEQQQIAAWNSTERSFPTLSVSRQFELQVEQSADAIALVIQHPSGWDESFTYGTINARANQLAQYLQQQGVCPGSLVSICLDRSAALIISLFAVLKTGAAYLPLDPTYPVDRLTLMQTDAQVAFCLTQAEFDTASKTLACPDNPSIEIAPNSLAYVIYTSGSTGQPKGVAISHASLSNYVAAAAEKFRLDAPDRVLQFASISFDAAAEEIYPTLLAGATLVLRSPDMISTAARFFQACQDYQLTVLDLPTAYWHQLIQQSLTESLPIPLSIRLIVIGGETANPMLLKAWQQYTHNQIRLLNTYGPTEATIVTTWWEVDHSTDNSTDSSIDSETMATVPIGQPIPNVQVYVLDQHLRPVSIGVPGELYIAGAGVAQGYWHQPEQTAAKFVHVNGDRLYRTGDRVRYLPDGNLVFLGRIDHQIKLRGFRIELGEIEAKLAQHPDIESAVVLYQSDLANPYLVAYIVSSIILTSASLRTFLARSLPNHMIPAQFVRLESLPLTPTGKLDRPALRLISQPQLSSAFLAAPRTPTEELLVGIWSTILGVAVGVEDNFFALGGHSLLATRVISEVRQVLGIEVPLRQLFEYPTIAAFAANLSSLSQPSTPPLQPVSRSEPLLLSFAQQRQWFLAQLEPDNPLYNIPAAIHITGNLNLSVLQRSFNHIIQRHETLRTVFLTVDGQPTQVISPQLQLEIPVIDLTLLPVVAQQQQVQYWQSWEAQQPISIDRLPLLRAKLLRLQNTEFVLLLTLHHIIADGWSMGILVQELVEIYSALCQGQDQGQDQGQNRSIALPQLSVQYADYAAWQQAQSEQLASQLEYWQRQLTDAPVLDLPTDRPRPPVRSLQGRTYRFSLSAALTNSLKQLSLQSGSTLFMTLLAALQVLLYRYTGSEDIVVGTAIANRHRSEIENLIGFFVNTLALRTDLSGNPPFAALLRRVREVTLSAYAHQDLPFEQLIDALQLQRSLSYTPLFQVMFVLQNAPFTESQVEGIQWTPLFNDSGTAKFDLTLSVQETDDGLAGSLEYSLDLFDESTIRRLIGHWETLLTAIATNSEQPISELPLLTQEERQLLHQWNYTQVAYPHCCIHEIFETQVAQTPTATALIATNPDSIDRTWSYLDLNQQANQLAHYLRALGATTETMIGVCLNRSPQAIVSFLAVLKTGATYLPLDPSLPLAHLQIVLQGAQVEILISRTRYPVAITQVNLELDNAVLSRQNYSNLECLVQPRQLAYVMYTSGSTGTPKGVCVSHQAVVRLVKRQNYVNLDRTEVILQAAPLTFDASTFEIWGALLNGGKLVLSSEPLTLEHLAERIATHQITTAWLTAGLFHLIVDEQLNSLQPLRQLLVGGDVLSMKHVQAVKQAYPRLRLVNGYGPTEGTTFTCCHTITEADLDRSSVPIGQPIANTQVCVLDTSLQPTPIGIPGELYITGDGLARGYLHQPALTAERFVPIPSELQDLTHNMPGSCLYRTGDRVRYLADGTLEYLGRLDQQVKIRGFRIEPGEIEAALVQLAEVQSATVIAYTDIAHTDTQGYKRLIAYVVLTQPLESLTQTLRQALLDLLPEYMIPAIFIPLTVLPLTPNGKVDRQALPAPQSTPQSMSFDRCYVAPRTAIEATLVGIWTAVLHLDQVSVTDNFFELGGDSILAIQIVSRAQQAQLQLTPKQLFQHQTIAELAQIVTVRSPEVSQAEQGLVTGEVPLTPIQQWFFEQQLPQAHHFNQAVLLSISNVRPPDLKQAIEHLQYHHDALRLQYHQTSTGWQQLLAQPDTLPFIHFDYSAVPNAMLLLEQTAATLQTSLDLSGQLIRVALFDLGYEQSSRLLIIIHHLLVDSVSWRILLQDLQTLYLQLSTNQSVQLLPKTVSIQHWSKYLHANVKQFYSELPYWLSQKHCTELTYDFVAASNMIADEAKIDFELSIEQTQILLTEVPKAYGTRMPEVLLTTLVLTLEHWIGGLTYCIDLEGYGRGNALESDIELPDVSRTVGWFTAIFPVLLSLTSTDLGIALRQVKEQLRQIPNQGIGYGILRYFHHDAEVRSTLSALPSAPISFNYLGQFDLDDDPIELSQATEDETLILRRSPESVGVMQSPLGLRPYVFEISAAIAEGHLQVSWYYSQQQYRQSTIATLLTTFHSTLLQLIEHCQLPHVGGYTPTDFALADLDHNQLDAVLATVTFGGES